MQGSRRKQAWRVRHVVGICAFIVVVVMCRGSEGPVDVPLADWKPQIAPHAPAWAIQRTSSGVVRFEVRNGDCNDHRRTPECVTGRERAELVDPFRPRSGSEQWYGYSLFIPKENPVLHGHITIGQWWSPSLVFAVQEVHGKLGFAVYTRAASPPVKRCLIEPGQAMRGRWLRIVVFASYDPAKNRKVEFFLNGARACSWSGPTHAKLRRLPIWKLGLYRPSLRRVKRPVPTQVVMVRHIRRGGSRAMVE